MPNAYMCVKLTILNQPQIPWNPINTIVSSLSYGLYHLFLTCLLHRWRLGERIPGRPTNAGALWKKTRSLWRSKMSRSGQGETMIADSWHSPTEQILPFIHWGLSKKPKKKDGNAVLHQTLEWKRMILRDSEHCSTDVEGHTLSRIGVRHCRSLQLSRRWLSGCFDHSTATIGKLEEPCFGWGIGSGHQ